jgi:alkylated DNA repair dioxygenase AlkB
MARITAEEPNQLIVNEYVPGQGIAPHVDSPAFGNEILSISLGSPCVMSFSGCVGAETCEILLEPGDLLRLRDEARYEWRHQIKPRKSDRWQGRTIKRARRLSLTFRKVL